MNETCPLQEEGWVFVEAIVAWEGSSPPTQVSVAGWQGQRSHAVRSAVHS